MSETWLSEDIYSNEVVDGRYVVYRNDRNQQSSSKSRGGGVLIAVDKRLNSCQLQVESVREELWIRVKINRSDLILCAIYIPPVSQPNVYLDHLNQVELLIRQYDQSIFCLIGDYNMSNISWTPSNEGNALSPSLINSCSFQHEFCDSLCYLGLNQFNHVRNNHGNILDLVLSNDLRVKVGDTDPLSKVDLHHPPLEITIPSIRTELLNHRPQLAYDFFKAPYVQINHVLNLIDWSFLDLNNLDVSVQLFYDCLYQVIENFVPKTKLYFSDFPSWVSRHTQNLISHKKVLTKNLKYLELTVITYFFQI